MLKFIQSNPDRFHPEDLRKFKSVPTQNKKFSAEYDWNENDPTMPEGNLKKKLYFGGHLLFFARLEVCNHQHEQFW